MKKVRKNYDEIISSLEDEIIRKQKKIDELKQQNIILLKTALKSHDKLKSKKNK
jgi:hypothetical protein|tara:strand:- start:108 stop:269 length:162 start_codon:yes stop_codon:yes gene_type:complete